MDSSNLNSKSLVKLLTTGGLTGLIIIILMMSAFHIKKSNLRFTCSRYILNTYLYVFLSFLIIALSLVSAEHHKFNYVPTTGLFFGLFLLSIGFLVLTMLVTPNSTSTTIIKHILWLAFILMLTALFYPLYRSITDNKIIISAIVTTLTLVLLLSVFAFKRPDLISLTWGPILFTLLVTVIIFELVLFLFVPKLRLNNRSLLSKVMAYVVILLFIFYILYDTKMMTIRAKACKDNADYISESLHLFLDIFNIFIRIISLNR